MTAPAGEDAARAGTVEAAHTRAAPNIANRERMPGARLNMHGLRCGVMERGVSVYPTLRGASVRSGCLNKGTTIRAGAATDLRCTLNVAVSRLV